MNKKDALKTLIQTSDLLNHAVKDALLSKVDTYSDEDINALGKYLATILKADQEIDIEQIKELESFIDQLRRVEQTLT